MKNNCCDLKNAVFSLCCEKCGEKHGLMGGFCEKCGAPLPTFLEQITILAKFSFAFCKKKKWPFAVIGGLIAIIILISIITSIPRRVDLTDYLVYSVSGCDGYGELDVDIDIEALGKKLLGKKPAGDNKDTYEEFIEYSLLLEEIQQSLYVHVNDNANLSNKSLCLVTVIIDDFEIFSELGYEFKELKQSVVVEIGTDTPSLAEPTGIDIFSKVSVEFDGSNGNGEAYIVMEKDVQFTVIDSNGNEQTVFVSFVSPLWGYDSFEIRMSGKEQYINLQVDISQENGLSNGDKVTLAIQENNLLFEFFGLSLTSYEKVYEVSGLE